MTLEQIRAEIATLTKQIGPLVARRDELRELEREMEAQQWLDANNVTRADIQLSSGDGVPQVLMREAFVDWLAKQPSPKRFVEWNTEIYRMADFMRGYLADCPATIDDLPE